ncbi:MAG TPA: hypothetical protein VF691_01990 [Cytophagaceae bacterium]
MIRASSDAFIIAINQAGINLLVFALPLDLSINPPNQIKEYLRHMYDNYENMRMHFYYTGVEKPIDYL